MISFKLSSSVLSDSVMPWTAARQTSLSFTISQSLLNSCLLSWWCHLTISSSIASFSSCPQSFPASGSFLMNLLFTSDGQSIGASASVLPINIQGWFSLGLTDLISLLSRGLSGVFSSTTVQKHQFFSIQPSLWSNSHICRDYWKNHSFDYTQLCWQSNVSAFNTLSRFVITFLSGSKHLLISWLQSQTPEICKHLLMQLLSTLPPIFFSSGPLPPKF